MKTLCDNLRLELAGRNVAPLLRLLEIYDDEKDIAKCYAAFAFLSCAGAGGSQVLAETMAKVIEGFYMATSVHDDVLDANDEHVRQHRTLASPNTYMILGDAGENLFMGLTVRDDLRDLRDDIRNNVLTLAPALFLEGYEGEATEFHQLRDSAQIEALVDLVHCDGAIGRSLARGRDYTTRALAELHGFLRDKDEMNWFLLQMIFRLTNKRIHEFRPDHVRTGELGIGFSALNAVLDPADE